MPLTWTHPFSSAVADGADATLVRPSNWNAAHTVAGAIAGALIFASSASALDNAANTTWDNTNQILALGSAPQNTLFAVPGKVQITTPVGTSYSLAMFGVNANANGPGIASTKTRGTTPSTHVAVIAGDNLGGFDYGASDGTGYAYAATWEVIVDGAVALNSVPARFSWRTTPVGGTTATERMRLTSGGSLQLFGGGTITASLPALDITQTWNNAAVAFTGFKHNITATAYAAGSKLFDFQVGGTSVLYSLVNGQIFAPWGMEIGATVNINGGSLSLTAPASQLFAFSGRVALGSPSAGILAQTNLANAQGFFVYNTSDTAGYTAPTNFERGVFDWTTNANVLTIGTQAGGTGTARDIDIVTGGSFIKFKIAGVELFRVQNGDLVKTYYGIGFGSNLAAPDTILSRSSANVATLGSAFNTGDGTLKLASLQGSGATVTASTPILDLSQTWNNVAVAFTALKLNVTSTASAAGSALIDCQIGGTSQFKVLKTGEIQAGDATNTILLSWGGDPTNRNFRAAGGIAYYQSGAFSWGSAGSGFGVATETTFEMAVGSINGLSLRQVTTATPTCVLALYVNNDNTRTTGFHVYNTGGPNSATNPTNYERAVFDWTTTANTLTIGVQAGGAGTNTRKISFVTQGAERFSIDPGAGKVAVASSYGFSCNNFAVDNFSNTIYVTGGIITWSADTAISRAAANVLDVNNGTAGTAAYVRLNGVAVASLPAASATYKGARGTVTDANSTTFGTTVAGGGANVMPVFCTGTAWIIG